jgi:F-type H+-transporting ATPase subunit epsilon
MATFHLELVTPERVLLSEVVRSVRLPGIEGSFGVLVGHAPLMTALTVGVIKVEYENGDLEYIAAAGGFVEVRRDRVVVLADSAERAQDIDVALAEAAIARAQENLANASAIDYDEARAGLERAKNLLKTAQMSGEK